VCFFVLCKRHCINRVPGAWSSACRLHNFGHLDTQVAWTLVFLNIIRCVGLALSGASYLYRDS